MASIILIYGSTGGNTEMVCFKLASLLEKKGNKVTLERAEISSPSDIKKYDLCVLASSTYGHGSLEKNMASFMEAFKKEQFTGQKFAVLGLGDNKYDVHYNVEAVPILEKEVKEVGGGLMTGSLRVNKSPFGQMDRVDKWANELASAIAIASQE